MQVGCKAGRQETSKAGKSVGRQDGREECWEAGRQGQKRERQCPQEAGMQVGWKAGRLEGRKDLSSNASRPLDNDWL